MKIKFTRSIAIKGEHHEAGTTTDLPEGDAKYFILTGDAVEAKASEKPEKAEK